MRRQIWIFLTMALLTLSSTGCIMNQYSSNPTVPHGTDADRFGKPSANARRVAPLLDERSTVALDAVPHPRRRRPGLLRHRLSDRLTISVACHFCIGRLEAYPTKPVGQASSLPCVAPAAWKPAPRNGQTSWDSPEISCNQHTPLFMIARDAGFSDPAF